MFFGLTNSPATFQALMDSIFDDFIKEGKIIVVTPTKKQQTTPETRKCTFEQPQVEFFGAIVSEGCIKMEEKKLKVIDNMHRPQNLTELCSFVQFCNFDRTFIKTLQQTYGALETFPMGRPHSARF